MRYVMSFRSLAILLFAISVCLPRISFAGQVCFSEEDAKKILIEVKENRANQEIINEQEKLITNLKEQNRILREQVELLRESLAIQKNQTELYKVSYEAERKKNYMSIFEKGKWLGIGIITGILLFNFAF